MQGVSVSALAPQVKSKSYGSNLTLCQANVNGWEPSSVAASGPASGTGMYGSCCAEVDIWAANYASTALIALPCSNPSQTICTGSSCSSTCDPSGCAFNPYQMGNTTFYGSGQTIDTAQKFTVVTQFLTTDGTSTGTLSEIKRFYIQNGITYQNPESNIASVEGNSLTSTFCAAQKTAFIADVNAAQFEAQGGLSSISKALAGGMVLTFSYWDDKGDDLSWLDGIYPLGADVTTPGVRRGPCLGQDASLPVTELATSSVYFSNVRFGEIGSTV
jgi:cellulose 1,4-beta-cellobiosidase